MPFKIIRNDITRMSVDVIVNSANPRPIIGGGVDFAIHEAGGRGLIEARIALGNIETSEVKYTRGFNLDCKYVFHTVGPVYRQDDDTVSEKLYLCYKNCLDLAVELEIESIAFPLISTGVFGYPRWEAIDTAIKAIRDFLDDNYLNIYLVIFDRFSYEMSKTFDKVKSYISSNIVDRQWERENAFGHRQKLRSQVRKEEIFYDKAIDIGQLDITWQESLFELIDSTGMTDAEVYKKANIDRRHFAKIRKDRYYHPSKNTAIALAIALELDLDETQELLAKAGYRLSDSIKFDLIIKYFLENDNHDIFEINNTLFEFDQELLGL